MVSVNDLEPEILRRYLDFAVFPEDTPIPEAVLQTLWEPQGLNQYDLQNVVEQLVGRSLVQRDESGRLSVHEFQLDYLRKQFDDLTKLHSQLLEVYRTKTKEGLWHTLPDDGYIHLYTYCASGEVNDCSTLSNTSRLSSTVGIALNK